MGALLPMMIPIMRVSQSQFEKQWVCDHCYVVNPVEKLRCNNCGAPVTVNKLREAHGYKEIKKMKENTKIYGT